MDTLQQAKWEMIDAGGRTAQTFGVGRLFGQLFVLLYLSGKALSLDEIARELAVSKASVSITCRQLEGWGAIRRAWIRGDRKAYYVAESDFGTVINNGILSALNTKLDSAQTQIQRSLSLLAEKNDDSTEVQFMRERLKEAERYRARVVGLLRNPLVKKLL